MVAGNLFWIMIGILYILYRAFKDHPGETLAGILLCGGIVGGIIAFAAIVEGLSTVCFPMSMAFILMPLAILLGWLIKSSIDEEKKRNVYNEKYNTALQIALNEEPNEVEIKKWIKFAWTGSISYYQTYKSERIQYRYDKDKMKYRDMIIDDYIHNRRVYKIMNELDRKEKNIEKNN